MLRAGTMGAWAALTAAACVAAVVGAVPAPPVQAAGRMPAGLSAGRSGGAPVVTDTHCASSAAHDCGMAGYQASSRGFRYAQALITVPGQAGSVRTDAALYVALDHSSGTRYDYARAGIAPCVPGWKDALGCPAGDTSGWEVFARVIQPGAPAAEIRWPLSAAAEGGAVLVSAYFGQAAGTVRVRAQVPDTGLYATTFRVHRPVYIRAEALADWTLAATRPRPAPLAQAGTVRLTQFAQGAFTTVGGYRGTFRGRWVLRPVEATTTGRAAPAGVLIAAPGGLWTSHPGAGGGDAFGLWATGGQAAPAPSPSPPPPARYALTVSAGEYHTCAVHGDHTLWCWGENGNGQLGDGTTNGSDVPVQETTAASDWAAVTAGYVHTCAIKTTGTLWCWGDNGNGQLGDGNTSDSHVPVQESTASNWAAVAAGYNYTCAIKTTGTLWCWGDNGNGQLGDGTTNGSDVPVQETTAASNWAAVAAGYNSTCAIKTTGTLWCWGNNGNGQLGNGTTNGSDVPVQETTAASDWAAVTVGYVHTCAIKTTGTLWCWGNNGNGQLGNGTTNGSDVPVQETTAASDWAAVAAGNVHTCAVKTTGTLWCWGYDGDGQLGNGTTNGSDVPVQETAAASDWAAVSSGYAHTCAIKTTGAVWCWGYNGDGQLGDGTNNESHVPVQVTG
jgi:alpha-tubulin suppressor-like RCC1 family protein